jgi:hypothetical protein
MLKGAGLPVNLVGSPAMAPAVAGQVFGTPCFQYSYDTLAANTLYATPFIPEFTTAIDQLSFYVATGVAGNAKIGLARAGSDNLPGVIFAENTTDLTPLTSSNITTGTFATNPVLTKGVLHYVLFCTSGTPGIACYTGTGPQNGGINWIVPVASNVGGWFFSTGGPSRFTRALTYVSSSQFFPGTFGACTIGNGAPGSPVFSMRAA